MALCRQLKHSTENKIFWKFKMTWDSEYSIYWPKLTKEVRGLMRIYGNYSIRS